MLLIAFEPAFSEEEILKKLNKELAKVNELFFLIICIVIKSFSYIQMGFQIFNQDFFADIGTNTADIQANADEIDANFKSVNKAEIINLEPCKTTSK